MHFDSYQLSHWFVQIPSVALWGGSPTGYLAIGLLSRIALLQTNFEQRH